MKLTVKSEYALLALLYLARHGEGRKVSVQEIAEKEEIPQRFLQQILQTLRLGHYVNSSKGKSGGFALARPAKKIILSDIIRLLDGPLAPVDSASKYFYVSTPIEREKKLFKVFVEIRDFVATKLESTTLADVA